MFAVKITDFSPKKTGQRKISTIMGLKCSKNILEVWLFLYHKNYTNTPSVLELWVLEVGQGMRQRGKEPVTFLDLKNICLYSGLQNCLCPENFGGKNLI